MDVIENALFVEIFSRLLLRVREAASKFHYSVSGGSTFH